MLCLNVHISMKIANCITSLLSPSSQWPSLSSQTSSPPTLSIWCGIIITITMTVTITIEHKRHRRRHHHCHCASYFHIAFHYRDGKHRQHHQHRRSHHHRLTTRISTIPAPYQHHCKTTSILPATPQSNTKNHQHFQLLVDHHSQQQTTTSTPTTATTATTTTTTTTTTTRAATPAAAAATTTPAAAATTTTTTAIQQTPLATIRLRRKQSWFINENVSCLV